jgi:hypothetical protein
MIDTRRIDTRAELINALTEAAELEHGLLCQYLFAAFSMKRRPDEGVSDTQAELIRGWEGVILEVARQEMAHLGTVCNLLTAVGGAPHFRRPNFPQPAPYYPAGVEFTLQPFGDAALERFILFERPEHEDVLLMREIAPDELAYTRVGDLYQQIQDAFAAIDEQTLFIGPREAQDTDNWSQDLRLSNVVDRATAIQAIAFIIEDGEGKSLDRESSHYAKFRRIRERLAAELAQHSDFAPARPVVENPLTRPHRDAPGRGAIISELHTREVAELFNVVYETMMLMLMQFYAFSGETIEQRRGLQASIRQTMSAVIRPLGEVLTQLPAGPEFPGQTAGPGFEFYADLRIPSSPRSAWIVFHERLAQHAAAGAALSRRRGAPKRLRFIAENLFVLARNIQDLMKLQELPHAHA